MYVTAVPNTFLQEYFSLSFVFGRFFEKEGTKTREDYCQIINHVHFDRVKSFLDSAGAGGAKIVFGGNTDRDSRFIEPTVLCNVSLESEVMKEEIFTKFRNFFLLGKL